MSESLSAYLTTKELAELLRLKERKIYELAASGVVPCTRATGKLLFSRRAVEAWMAQNSTGPAAGGEFARRDVFLGSHDPLLEWAVRESACGCATFFDGSLDGLTRFANLEGIAAGLHIYSTAQDDWNVHQVEDRFIREPVVLMEFGWRERGLIVAGENPLAIDSLRSLAGRNVVSRQATAGSHTLLVQLLDQVGVPLKEVKFSVAARTETDAAIAVLDGNADAAFGLLAMAQQFRLGFVPIIRERFDMLIDRRAWFEPSMQTFMAFCRSGAFSDKALSLGGYDCDGFGTVHFNG